MVTLSSLKKIFNEDSSSLGMTSLIIASYNNAKTINRSRMVWYYPLASPSTHRSMLNCYHFLRLSTNVTTIDQAMVDGIPNGNDAKSSNLKESYIKVILMNEVGILDG
jgi:hypothetical protein